jgi:expansin (peptidoglycan-binding protein)
VWGIAAVVALGGGGDVVPGNGTATYYDSTDGGNCGFPSAPADHLDVALSHVEYGTADACGGYLDVVGPSGTVRVEVTNQCPECEVGHIDLSQTAFGRIAPMVAGQVPVSYSLVRNPPLDRPISIRVKTGSSRWWMQIQALDHGNPLASFELKDGDGWRKLVHSNDNFWTAENPGPGDGPFTVRITDIYGQSVTIDGIGLLVDQVQPTQARLYGPGAGSGTAAPPPATTAPPTTAAPTTTAPPTTQAPTTTTATTTTTTPPTTRSRPTRAIAASQVGTGKGPGTSTVVLLVGTVGAIAAAAGALQRRRGAQALPGKAASR